VLNPTIDQMKESSSISSSPARSDAVLMVESEAKELDEETMLKAVMFGHRGFQPVIDAIIKLAEKAAKEPRDFNPADVSRVEKAVLAIAEKPICAPPTRSPAKQERYKAVDAAKAKVMAAFAAGRWRGEVRQGSRSAACSRSCRQDRALEHPRHQEAHRRPRP
jgi:polyribonucleotide nucleotidyltransferase